MPEYVATIEVWFDADSLDQAGRVADCLADAVGESPEPSTITAIVSSAAPAGYS